MKTIAQFVQQGIASTDELKDALQTAMRLEFSTIPPYLCAEWSIDFNNDPDNVMPMIHGVVVQEMYHFALAGNMLSAIGGKPAVANASFLTAYPAKSLPGGIAQAVAVDLLPLSQAQLQVFMQIEQPEFPPVGLVAMAVGPPTIADFYDTVSGAFTTYKPAIDLNAHYVPAVGQIKTVDDALAAIERIKTEGEGTQKSPDQPAIDGNQLAHYYTFKQIHVGKQMIPVGDKWDFVGPPIRFPNVMGFAKSPADPDLPAFKQQLALLLTNLEMCWTTGAAPDIDGMTQLQELGIGLIQKGVRPEFVWS
jgi:hypothetical protein